MVRKRDERAECVEPTTVHGTRNGAPLLGLSITVETTDCLTEHEPDVIVHVEGQDVVLGSRKFCGGEREREGGPYPLTVPVARSVDYRQTERGQVRVAISPTADLEWHFRLRLEMVFAAGGTRRVTWSHLNLDRDRPYIDLYWS
jgi:hypothetical protein